MENLTVLTNEFDVRDCLGGELTGDYEADLARANSNGRTFDRWVYGEAYQNDQQP